MGPKEGRRVRKIVIPRNCELEDTAANVQGKREERKAREREEEAQKQREEARGEKTTHSAEERVAEKQQTDRTQGTRRAA